MLTLLSGFAGPRVGAYLWFFQNLRFLRVYQSVNFLRRKNPEWEGTRWAAILFYLLGVVSYIFCAALFMFTVENFPLVGGQISGVMDSVYYIVITITTVGYGDINPVTTVGRTVIMFIIVGALIYIPISTTQLITILANAERTVRFNSNYVILSIADPDLDPTSFLKQFFISDAKEMEAFGTYPTNVAIVVNGHLHSNCKEFIKQPLYRYRVAVLNGDISHPEGIQFFAVISSHVLEAKLAGVPHADGIFLLAKQKTGVTDDAIDTKTILTATLVQSMLDHGSSSSRIFVQVLIPVDPYALFICADRAEISARCACEGSSPRFKSAQTQNGISGAVLSASRICNPAVESHRHK